MVVESERSGRVVSGAHMPLFRRIPEVESTVWNRKNLVAAARAWFPRNPEVVTKIARQVEPCRVPWEARLYIAPGVEWVWSD